MEQPPLEVRKITRVHVNDVHVCTEMTHTHIHTHTHTQTNTETRKYTHKNTNRNQSINQSINHKTVF